MHNSRNRLAAPKRPAVHKSLTVLQSVDARKSPRHRPQNHVLATYRTKGKVYPYNSTKRGWHNARAIRLPA